MPDQKGPPPPPPMHEIMELKERLARLEGMVEVLLHSKHGHCECPECKEGK